MYGAQDQSRGFPRETASLRLHERPQAFYQEPKTETETNNCKNNTKISRPANSSPIKDSKTSSEILKMSSFSEPDMSDREELEGVAKVQAVRGIPRFSKLNMDVPALASAAGSRRNSPGLY